MFGGVSNNQGQGLQLLVSDETTKFSENCDAESSATGAATRTDIFTLNTPGSTKTLRAMDKGALQYLTVERNFNPENLFDQNELADLLKRQPNLKGLKVLSSPHSTATVVLDVLGKFSTHSSAHTSKIAENQFASAQTSINTTNALPLPNLQTLILEDTAPCDDSKMSGKKPNLPLNLSNLMGRPLTTLVISNYGALSNNLANQALAALVSQLPELKTLDLRLTLARPGVRQQLWVAMGGGLTTNTSQTIRTNSPLGETKELQHASANPQANLPCKNLEVLNLSGWHLSTQDCTKLANLIDQEKLPQLRYLTLVNARVSDVGLSDLVRAFVALQERRKPEEFRTSRETDQDSWCEVSLPESSSSSHVNAVGDSPKLGSSDTNNSAETNDNKITPNDFHSTAIGLIDFRGCKLVDKNNKPLDEISKQKALATAKAEALQYISLGDSGLSTQCDLPSRTELSSQSPQLGSFVYKPVENYFGRDELPVSSN